MLCIGLGRGRVHNWPDARYVGSNRYSFAGVVTSWSYSLGSINEQKFSSFIPSMPSAVVGTRVSTSVCRVNIITAPPSQAREGQPFTSQPVLQVLDSAGLPVRGVVSVFVGALQNIASL